MRVFVTMGCAAGVAATLMSGGGCAPAQPDDRPNIVWIVWDTVRADHLGVYGYDKPTTPYLDEWSETALVFENCISAANSTAPSHASMFTGLLPTQHACNNQNLCLDIRLTTIAEHLKASGYRTYMYAANPHLARDDQFDQGFDVAEYPWDKKYEADAVRILQDKISPKDQSNDLPARIRDPQLPRRWAIKASGALAQRGVESWLETGDRKKPFFIFLNYMEAHQPYVPPEKYRRRLMTPDQIRRSYLVDRSWMSMWSYTFGLREYSREELDITAATYDACLGELDDLFKELMTSLEASGRLRNTIVILTADHGEQLGEHHMLDHQFSLHGPLINVPLIIKGAPRFKAGREARPVMNFDLFPTVLELAGLKAPPDLDSAAVSLLAAEGRRLQFSECPSPFWLPIDAVRREYPTWNPKPWVRRLRAVIDGKYKYIWGSDRRCELYDIKADPGELNNLLEDAPQEAIRLSGILEDAMARLSKPVGPGESPKPQSAEQIKRLESLGYAGSTGKLELDDPLEPAPATQPSAGSVCP